MSAQTTAANVQDIIESRLEKRTKGNYVPAGGETLSIHSFIHWNSGGRISLL